jgi:hypothetical protein
MSEQQRQNGAADGRSALEGVVSGYWPAPTEKDRYLYALAAEYHERTEAYDRMVCTGPICHGAIMPATPHEMALINRNALAVMRGLQDRAMREQSIERREVAQAIQRHDR